MKIIAEPEPFGTEPRPLGSKDDRFVQTKPNLGIQ